jgi:hypothetical protein
MLLPFGFLQGVFQGGMQLLSVESLRLGFWLWFRHGDALPDFWPTRMNNNDNRVTCDMRVSYYP